MRKLRTIVAMLATAVMFSSLVSPVVAAGKKSSQNNFFGPSLSSIFDFGGGSSSTRKGKSYKAPTYGNGPSHWFDWDDGKKKGGKKKGKKGHHSGGHNGGFFDITFFETPGTPYSAPTDTIVYFGTCLNPAGFRMAGNAGPDGQCEPFESLVGNEGSNGTGPTCTITTTRKSGGGGPSMYSSESQGGGSTSTTETVNGSCAAYQAANPPMTGHDEGYGHHEDDEEEDDA